MKARRRHDGAAELCQLSGARDDDLYDRLGGAMQPSTIRPTMSVLRPHFRSFPVASLTLNKRTSGSDGTKQAR